MAKKVQITLNEQLIDRVDNYADDHFMSRSQLIAQSLAEYLAAREALDAMKKMSAALQQIAKQGTISDDELRELQFYQELISRVGGIK